MISQWSYLAALIISITCLVLMDYRWKLAFWRDRRRTLITLSAGIVIFIVWDILGIAFGIFSHGTSRFALPFVLAPEFPIEELFFLFLLSYVTLLLYVGARKLWPRISS